MVDVQITKAEFSDGVLTITGVGFTRTTTRVFADGEPVDIEVPEDFDGTEVTARVESRPNEVYATKNYTDSNTIQVEDSGAQTETAGPTEGQESDSVAPSPSEEAGSAKPFDPGGDVHREGYKTETPNQTPGDLVKDDLSTTTDVSTEQLATAGNAGAEAKQDPAAAAPNHTPYAEGEHLDHDFRTRVENTKAVSVEEQGIGPRDPYPEGNPPDPEFVFQELHGFPRPEPTEGQGPQTRAPDQAASSDPQRRRA